ncbi:Fe2+-dependent dioxygenase [Solimicrobium silvestre]|uniref:Putative iron-regulated protein n=1 Tax=Solimicrobium silvestre TaxID=2099400 RepID=A0A2S9GVY7_9BURK|nr:Fe2+-dependent dioxygenase [Solimicrobium silvestre]PRC91871.1 putative iron-regulated protein [Solimicrobium silvestre]
MLLQLKQILLPEEVTQARTILAHAPWGDGRVTSGAQAAQVKNNSQLPEQCDAAQALQKLVLQGLKRNSAFFSAALPKHISPPLFNHYGGSANNFGDHVDSSVRYLHNGERVRTDISCTLFLSEPHDYCGGELVIADGYRDERIKLAAGDLILYSADRIHRVEAVTEGQRYAGFFWIESMVRQEDQRRMLYAMDTHLINLREQMGETHSAVIGLTSTYHNLLRMWVDT